MIACTDVHYSESYATAACLLFRNWPDDQPYLQVTKMLRQTARYEPGQFYRRELPALTALLERVTEKPQVVVIDGYVWLGNDSSPGLGAYLYEALGRTTGVIGVAKTLFREGPAVRAITRGTSLRPLYVSAAGLDLNEAAARVIELHGKFRIPTLLKKVDRVCRDLERSMLF